MNTKTCAEDMELAEFMISRLLVSLEKFPLSYNYCGRLYNGLPVNAETRIRRIDANITEIIHSGRIDDTLLIEAECVRFADYPIAEWTVWFRCETAESGMLTDVCAADIYFTGTNPVLTSNSGDYFNLDGEGYVDTDTPIPDGKSFAQCSVGGRPSNRAFPYQRLMFNGFGLNIAIGWPADWSSSYTGEEQGVHFQAGQKLFHSHLKPGEAIRTPRIAIMAFNGDVSRGMNLWRRWFNAHVMPRRKGDKIAPHIYLSDPNGGNEHTLANEKNQLEAIDTVRDFGLGKDALWWIDAGWYPCIDENNNIPIWWQTGTVWPDPARFPHGLAPIGKACREAELDFLLWFEIERVWPGRWLDINHPEWVLRVSDDHPEELKYDFFEKENGLLNFGHPECLHWVCEHVSNLLVASGVSCYREDFNFNPNPYWQENETDDRRGMLENKHVQGHLYYWDYLLEHVPDLWIDSCASGGRRNDLESMRRAVPLHPTDAHYGNQPVNQAYRRTLCAWIPYVRGWSEAWDKDSEFYPKNPNELDLYSSINGFGVMGFLISEHIPWFRKNPDKLPLFRKIKEIWKEYAYYQLNGDFYPLTQENRKYNSWTVFQYYIPEADKGVFWVMRNCGSLEESLTVFPQGIILGAEYIMEDRFSERSLRIESDKIISEGITFTQPPRSGSVWFYHKVINSYHVYINID